MLCDRVLGNVHDEPPARYAGKTHDLLEITWRDCTRRALRARHSAAQGRPVAAATTDVEVRHG